MSASTATLRSRHATRRGARIDPARLARTAGLYLGLALLAVIFGFPFFWVLTTSLKGGAELYAWPPVWIPTTVYWSNFPRAMELAPFGRYALNTLAIATGVTASTLFFCSLAGYAFARLAFPGRNILFVILLTALMLPPEVTLVPRFLVARYFPLVGGNDLMGQGGQGLVDSLWGVGIPQAVSVFGVFFMRQFFQTLPRELEDAARADGAGEFRIFWQIMLPLATPALATLGIFTFDQVWNDFIWPLVILNSRDNLVVQIGLQQLYQINQPVQWELLMAASVVVTLPVLIVFLIGQRWLVKGIATTGIKG